MPPTLVHRAIRELDLLEPLPMRELNSLNTPAILPLSSMFGAAGVLLKELQVLKANKIIKIFKANNRVRYALAEQVRQAAIVIDKLVVVGDPNALAGEVMSAIVALWNALIRAHSHLCERRTRRRGVFTWLLRAGSDVDALRYAREDVHWQRAFTIYQLQAHAYIGRTIFQLSQSMTQNHAELRSDMLDRIVSDELDKRFPIPSATGMGREDDLARIGDILIRDDTLQYSVLHGNDESRSYISAFETNPFEVNYDFDTQDQYFHTAEGSSSSNHEDSREVYLSVRYRTSSSALGSILSSQEYVQQNISMETFFTALNTIVTVATYYTAEDSADIYITNFADFLREFRDLDITGQIEGVSPFVGGIGGTASIRQASYRDLPVAVKIISAAHANEKFVKRLAREIAVWRTLSHKNVLPLYGLYYYAEERVPAMVSPWCSNGNIVEYLAARSHLQDADMEQLQLRLLIDTLEGLSCLHQERIVHGDLKGPNILVSDDGTACIADFGVSAVLRDHPQSASAAGTFRWMAPELLFDDIPQRTRESDMWAFGCVMVEVLSGKPPFHAIKHEPVVIIAVFEGATPPRPPQASEMMWECCQECFRRRPEDRITADILLLRLRALAEVTNEGSAVALPPQEPQREQAPAISTSYEGYSV